MRLIKIKKFYHADSGASSVEYAILASCIALVIITAVALFGDKVNQLLQKGVDCFK
jgi:Flp pilus assembly pilin Flp